MSFPRFFLKGHLSGALRQRDFVAGLLFLSLGILVCAQSAGLEQGTAERMGPGYLPLRLGLMLSALGLVIAVKGLRGPRAALGGFTPGPIAAATAALILFGLAIEPAGLIPASVLLVLGARAINWRGRLFELTLLVWVLAAIAVVVFRYGLGIPVALWPSWQA